MLLLLEMKRRAYHDGNLTKLKRITGQTVRLKKFSLVNINDSKDA